MSEPKRLRDCRGFVDTINELCTCGGSNNHHGCDACKIYHAIGDWLTVEEPALSGKVVPIEGGEAARMTVPDDILLDIASVCNFVEKNAKGPGGMIVTSRILSWLESLPVAPKDAPTFSELVERVGDLPMTLLASHESPKPVEKRCGTCAAQGDPLIPPQGECAERIKQLGTGESYACWKAKP